jgi:hypothetical protein
VPVRVIFEAPTIATLSEAIEIRLIEQLESLTVDEAPGLVSTRSA